MSLDYTQKSTRSTLEAIHIIVTMSVTSCNLDMVEKKTQISPLVGYLTPDSDLDLAPDPDQVGALPPVRYINL